MNAASAVPRRGEIWTADTGTPPVPHWVLIVSVDARNRREHIDSVLTIPFGSAGVAGPTVMQLEPGETGLPGPSYLKGHFVSVLKKAQLKERGRSLSGLRMRQVVMLIRRSLDPDAPAWQPPAP